MCGLGKWWKRRHQRQRFWHYYNRGQYHLAIYCAIWAKDLQLQDLAWAAHREKRKRNEGA